MNRRASRRIAPHNRRIVRTTFTVQTIFTSRAKIELTHEMMSQRYKELLQRSTRLRYDRDVS
jgi:hypothetical protein